MLRVFASKLEDFSILVIEKALRLVQRLDPRLYSERLRIERVRDGRSAKDTNKFFILVLYTKDALPGFTSNLIAAIARSPFNLIVVSNAPLGSGLADELLANC